MTRKKKRYVMKWIILIFVLAIAYAILTDNMGGARDAAGNYNKLLANKPVTKSK